MLTCPLAPGITCSLLGCACHSACGTTLSPKRDQNYARSETKFTPEASQNLRPKRTPPDWQTHIFQRGRFLPPTSQWSKGSLALADRSFHRRQGGHGLGPGESRAATAAADAPLPGLGQGDVEDAPGHAEKGPGPRAVAGGVNRPMSFCCGLI